MKHLRTIMIAVSAFAVVAGLTLPPLLASAAESASLSINPRKNYVVEPGESVNDTLTIRNLDREEPLNLNLRVIDFTFNDDTGTPKLLLDENEPQTTWSLKPFLTVPKSVSIEPNETQTLDMSVAIPENQGAGSFYSAIVYSSGDSEGGNVGLSASGVTLVFTSVPGDVNEDLQLEKLGAYREENSEAGDGYVYLNSTMPKSIAYTLKNSGNVVESPAGTITLKHLFGKETIIQNINPNNQLALIGQTRTFTSCIVLKEEEVDFNGSRAEATTCGDAKLWPGYYSVDLAALYGQNGNLTQELNGSGSFWYLPWWFLLIVGVLALVIAYYVWKIRRFINRKRGPSIKKRSSRRK